MAAILDQGMPRMLSIGQPQSRAALCSPFADSGSEVSTTNTTSPRESPSPESAAEEARRKLPGEAVQLPRFHPYQTPPTQQSEENAAWRRNRKSRYSDYQQLVLERVYLENQYPDYEKIAANLALSPHSVVYWFQARRRKQAKEKRASEQKDQHRHAQFMTKSVEGPLTPVDAATDPDSEPTMRLAQRSAHSTPRKAPRHVHPRKQSRPSSLRSQQRSDSASPVQTATPAYMQASHQHMSAVNAAANMFQSQGFQYPASLHQLAQMSGSYPLLQALSNVQSKVNGDRTDLDVLVEQREFLRRMLEHQEMLRYFWDQQLSMIQHLLSGCEARIVRERNRQQTNNNNTNNSLTNNTNNSLTNNSNNAPSTPVSKPATIHHIGQPLPAHCHPLPPSAPHTGPPSGPQGPPSGLPKSPHQSPPHDTVDGPLMPWDAELRKLSQRAAEEATKPRPAHSETRPGHLEPRPTLETRPSHLDALAALRVKTPPRFHTESVLDLSQNNQTPPRMMPMPMTPKEKSLPRDVPLTIDVNDDRGMDTYEFVVTDPSMNGDDSMTHDDDHSHDANNMDALESARRRIRKRTSFSKYQLERLEEEFLTTHYPSSYERETIADALGLNYEQVRIWFKNRRRKEAVMRGMNDFDLKIPHPSQLQVKMDQAVPMPI